MIEPDLVWACTETTISAERIKPQHVDIYPPLKLPKLLCFLSIPLCFTLLSSSHLASELYHSHSHYCVFPSVILCVTLLLQHFSFLYFTLAPFSLNIIIPFSLGFTIYTLSDLSQHSFPYGNYLPLRLWIHVQKEWCGLMFDLHHTQLFFITV